VSPGQRVVAQLDEGGQRSGRCGREVVPIVIAVTGMDGTLPTVLAGLVASLVIAVPTSVGYGITEGGKTALRGLLTSCAPGLVT